MLRITSQVNGNRETHLVLEGRIAGEWVEELRRITADDEKGTRRFSLDLSAVTYADSDGVALLHGLLDGTAKLERASAFVTALLGGAR